jgi:hypothetical protein
MDECLHTVHSERQRFSPKELSFVSNRQPLKEVTYCETELAGIKPTPPAPDEQGMPALTTRTRRVLLHFCFTQNCRL